LQERQIAFGERFEEPIFLEEILVFRVPNEWEVSVEEKREGTAHHGVVILSERKDLSTTWTLFVA
jgi:hypothetical protein